MSSKNYQNKQLFTFLILLTFPFLLQPVYGQCLFGNDVGNNDPENDFFWGQSFTAECDGVLDYVQFTTGNNGGTQMETTLRVFEGETVSGTPAYTQTVPEMTFSGAGESFRIDLDTPYPMVFGQKYTYELQIFVNLQISTSNPYKGGIAFENGTGFPPVDFEFSVFIGEVLGLDDTSLADQVSYSPNPVQNILNIRLTNPFETLDISISSLQGKRVFQDSFPSQQDIIIDTEDLATGFYLVTLITDSSRTTLKLIKD